MTNILDELCALRRADAAKAEKELPMGEVMARLADAPRPRDFAGAFRGAGANVIAELKRASPSEGMIRRDFRPAELARELEAAGAAALSVLCEPHRFLGGEEYLAEARGVTRLPVLYKDFLTTRYQIARARLAGADAVLLIAAALGDGELRELKDFAHELGMPALVETHDPDEIGRAVSLGCSIIGVNCRNLRNFATDVSLLERLVGTIPADRTAIAESGMHSREAVMAASAAGARGCLIGTALMRAASPGAKLAELTAPIPANH